MSIKAYKGLVVPFPCEKSWKWMLEESVKRCNNCAAPGDCIHVDCRDCVYNTAASRAEYYRNCFPERPKLTVEVFDRPDCPEWAKWAAVDQDGEAWWYENLPEREAGNWNAVPCQHTLHSRGRLIVDQLFDATDWKNSLIIRPVERSCSDCTKKEINTWKGLVIPVPPKKEWTWDHNKGCCAAGGADIAGCAGISCINCIYGSFHIKQFDEFYKYKFGTADSASCSTCKNYEPKDSPDREMIPVYEFDWYTQWKYSQREDKYYYIEDIRKNRARELKTGELVNELPADVIVVSPADPDPAVLIATAVQHVLTGNYYVIQKVEEDGDRIYVKDMDWEKSEFYKNFIDKWGRPVCYFTKVTED